MNTRMIRILSALVLGAGTAHASIDIPKVDGAEFSVTSIDVPQVDGAEFSATGSTFESARGQMTASMKRQTDMERQDQKQKDKDPQGGGQMKVAVTNAAGMTIMIAEPAATNRMAQHLHQQSGKGGGKNK